MQNITINISFISEKVSKVRWLPEEYALTHSFMTGSWGSRQNYLKIWSLIPNQHTDNQEFIPQCTSKSLVGSDISGIDFVDPMHAVFSATNGSVGIVTIERNFEIFKMPEFSIKKFHKFNNNTTAACLGISVFDKNIATVGEDGRLNIISSYSLNKLREFENADNCSLTAVSFLNHNEVIVGNRMGIMKLFDIRSNNDSPSSTMVVSCEDEKKSNSVTCLSYHPTQKHIILVGSEEGSITVWDLRQPNYPASYLSAHQTFITEMAFHKSQPTKFFTASANGELWLWNQNAMFSANFDSQLQKCNEIESVNPWLNGERAKNKINVSTLITDTQKSLNSFDVKGCKLLCGCDNEALYYIENIFI